MALLVTMLVLVIIGLAYLYNDLRHVKKTVDLLGRDLFDEHIKIRKELELLGCRMSAAETVLASRNSSARVYSDEMRATVLEYVKANINKDSQKTIAEMLDIPRSTLSSWIKEWKKDGLLPDKEIVFTPSPEMSQELNIQPEEE